MGVAQSDGEEREKRFEPLLLDPLFRWLAKAWIAAQPEHRRPARQKRPTNGTQVFIWAIVIVILFWLLAAGIEGQLTVAGASKNLGPTINSLVGSIPAISNLHEAGTKALFPLVDDLTSWALALAAAITFGLLYRQWKIMHGVIPELVGSGAIAVREPDAFAALLCKLNAWMASRRSTVMLALTAIVLSAFISFGLHHNGIYETLAPSNSRLGEHGWAQAAYGHWWAALHDGSWPGFAVFFFLLAVYLYYVLAQYTAGVLWVILTYRGAKLVDFHFDHSDVDGFFGWRPLRELMLTVYWSVLVQVMALLALLHLLTPGSYPYLGLILLLFAVLNPLYIATPIAIVTPRLKEERDRLAERVAAENSPPDDGAMKAHLDHEAGQAQTNRFIRSMPAFPIRGREFAFAAVTYGIPLVVFLAHL